MRARQADARRRHRALPLRVPLRRLVAPELVGWRAGSSGRGLRMSQRRRRRPIIYKCGQLIQ